jgi:hypothetical protein
MEYIIFWIAAFLSEVIGTIVGFGSSAIFLPISLFFFDFKTAIVLVAIFHIFGNIGRITFFRHGFSKRLIIIFGIPSVLLTILGALLINYVHQEILKLILGVFLIVYLFISWSGEFSFKPNAKNCIIGGSLSGFFAGLIGTGGVLRGAFLNSFKIRKEVYIATAAAIALAVDITRIPIYIGSGFLSRELIYLIPILFFIAIAGSFVGRSIVNKIHQKNFRKVVLIAIGLLSMKFIYDGIIYLV